MDQLHPVTIAIGAGNFAALLVVITMLWKIQRNLMRFFVEHEMLMQDYAKAHHLELADLPTRTMGGRGI